jgi:hypothetical protein
VGSTLTLVDLAGSERIKKSKVEGERLKEATSINKSLSALGNVVNAMFYERPHVPYRDSKLTRMLKNSFTGACKTMVICTLAPTSSCYDEVRVPGGCVSDRLTRVCASRCRRSASPTASSRSSPRARASSRTRCAPPCVEALM